MGNQLSTLLLLLFTTFSLAQNINGTVTNNMGNPIEKVTVLLLNSDEKIIAFTLTDKQGAYSIKPEQKGDFYVQINKLDYNKIIQKVTINTSDIIQNIVLSQISTTELEEIIIDAPSPITIKKDTVSYLVSGFTNGKEQVIEDLLKKLPGITVETDGTIKVGDKKIEKIMVDGDDFFNNGYKMLSKNMPVHPVEKVEVYSNFSNNRLLKGIENSEKVALNLLLDEKAKRQWFGNTELGYSITGENRYDVKAVLMNFGKNDKYFFIGNINNISYNNSGNLAEGINTYNPEDIGSVGDDIRPFQFLGIYNKVPFLDDTKTKFNNAEMLSSNAIFTLNENNKIKIQLFTDWDELNQFRNSTQTFNQVELNFINTENFTSRNKFQTNFGKIEWDKKFSKNASLTATSFFRYQTLTDNTNLLFNTENTTENLKTNKIYVDNKLNYTYRFNKNKAWVASARQIYYTTPQSYESSPFIMHDWFTINGSGTNQKVNNKFNFIGINATYLNRKSSDDLFTFANSVTYKVDALNSNFKINNPSSLINLSNYENQIKLKNFKVKSEISYLLHLNNLKLIPSGSLNYNSIFLSNKTEQQKRYPFYTSLQLLLKYDLNSKNRISTYYTFNAENTDIESSHQNYIQTNFRNFSKGLDQIYLLKNHKFSVDFKHGNLTDKFTLFLSVYYKKDNRYLAYTSFIEQNFQATSLTLSKNQHNYGVNSKINFYIKPIKNNLVFNTNITFRNYDYNVNEYENISVNNINTNLGIELRSVFKTFFNYHFSTQFFINKYNAIKTTSATNCISFLDLDFNLSKKINLIIKNEAYYFGQLPKNKNYYFGDIALNFEILPNKLSFSLTGKNIYNTKNFRTYSINDIYTTENSYQLIERYVLGSIKYRF